MMKHSDLLALLLVLLLLTVPDSSVAQVSTPSVPNAPQQAAVPAANTTMPNSTTNIPDRRHWPKPTLDNANFGLLLFDNLEYQGEGAFRWDLYGWHGGDYHRLWVKSEGSQSTGNDNDNEADVQLLYGKWIFPFVDLQLGVAWPVSGVEALGPHEVLP